MVYSCHGIANNNQNLYIVIMFNVAPPPLQSPHLRLWRPRSQSEEWPRQNRLQVSSALGAYRRLGLQDGYPRARLLRYLRSKSPRPAGLKRTANIDLIEIQSTFWTPGWGLRVSFVALYGVMCQGAARHILQPNSRRVLGPKSGLPGAPRASGTAPRSMMRRYLSGIRASLLWNCSLMIMCPCNSM